METGSEKEEVLTECPCGGSCLSTGLEDGGVRARASVCVCVCMRMHPIWMSIRNESCVRKCVRT